MNHVRILATEVRRLWGRVRALERQEMPIMQSTDDVSDPPTDAELDSAFGTPAQVGDGFFGLVQDNAQGKGWLCVTINGAWWYEELTQAV